MADDDGSFKEKVRNSFSNVKNDIFNLKTDVNSIKNASESNKVEIKDINSKINDLKEGITEIKTILASFKNPSTGNEGVVNNHQQSTVNSQQSTTINRGQQNIPKKTLIALEKDFEKQFKTLTDREFSVFMAILELEKQGGVNYSLLANHLNLTEPTVRGVANRLIAKGIPVKKERHFNGKTSLLIKEDFHDLNLLNKLIRLRENPSDQTQLFD
ncbi:hypothetical protein HOF78_03925 [Candidatus Woesearchaeota archaeon]|jgi:DNA-binding MarR family transcriptional regulator|nr:hypothetical protein [Candidatus Woesearchaeota archaeon]MBT6044613.1 hypothetical protein [Candidatus Woesearchaeota archaeon]